MTAKVELTADEWGTLMMILQEGSFRVVAPLMNKINMQLTEQLRPQIVQPTDTMGDTKGAA